MLTNEHRAIVKSTVPLLESGGEVLITHFYKMLMRDYPQVIPLFNRAHQSTGDQPRALANGVLMFARHIDQLEKLGPLVSTIVNKHVALQILPEHYPMVGDCLLRAIREVLGSEIATVQVLEAWARAYQLLADILIGAEAENYEHNANAPGGWRGGRRFVVTQRVVESDEITSFYFSPEDGKPVMSYAPGQYIGLRVFVPSEVNGKSIEEEARRQYSLSASPNEQSYRISVKREPGGVVSNYLHDHMTIGKSIELFPPSGEFMLKHSDKTLVLISGGVGITPMLPMLAAALPTGRPVIFIHAARHAGVHAFRQYTDDLAATHPQLRVFYCYEQTNLQEHKSVPVHANGYIDRKLLALWLPASRDIEAYFVGPKPFMKTIKHALRDLGVPESQTHYEFFGPAAALDEPVSTVSPSPAIAELAA